MVQRRRYATRDELVELLEPWAASVDERFPDGDYQITDIAREFLDALGEMGAPVDALVKITVEEPA